MYEEAKLINCLSNFLAVQWWGEIFFGSRMITEFPRMLFSILNVIQLHAYEATSRSLT